MTPNHISFAPFILRWQRNNGLLYWSLFEWMKKKPGEYPCKLRSSKYQIYPIPAILFCTLPRWILLVFAFCRNLLFTVDSLGSMDGYNKLQHCWLLLLKKLGIMFVSFFFGNQVCSHLCLVFGRKRRLDKNFDMDWMKGELLIERKTWRLIRCPFCWQFNYETSTRVEWSSQLRKNPDAPSGMFKI